MGSILVFFLLPGWDHVRPKIPYAVTECSREPIEYVITDENGFPNSVRCSRKLLRDQILFLEFHWVR